MNKREIDILSQYYQSELSYLRYSGMEFFKKYPKIAKKLDLSQSESSNSQVERLIESFAFLTGKLQKQIDSQFPEMASNLISVIYAPLVRPVPSATLMNFDIDMTRCVKTAGAVVPRGTQLTAKGNNSESEFTEVTFTTCSDLELWPLSIRECSLVTKDDVFTNKNSLLNTNSSIYYLKISLVRYNDKQAEMPKRLKFFINGNQAFKSNLLSAILMHEDFSMFSDANGFRNLGKVSPVGIEENEALYPYPESVFKGFRLLQEYFAFPDKFYGFSVDLSNVAFSVEHFCLYIPLGKTVDFPNTENILFLHAVPVVNLFKKITDPLRLTYRQMEYDLIADSRRNSSIEIYSIEKMFKIDQKSNLKEEIFPYFATGNLSSSDNASTFWYAKRVKSQTNGNSGEDIKISFVNNDFEFNYPAEQIFFADVICTNRHKAELVPAYTNFQVEQSLPVKKIYCVDRPTPQKSSIENGESLWKIISMLSLNSISFFENGAEKLKDIISVFSDGISSHLSSEINAIEDMRFSNVTKLHNGSEWRGFIRGTGIEIDFDNSVSNLGIPLSLILSNFFEVYCHINTYTELTTLVNGKRIKTWPIKIGLHNYL